jgi:ribosome assembly protein 1
VRPQQQQEKANEDEREKEAEKEAEAEPKPVDEKNKKPQSDKVFVAFARIFSGTLRAGQKVHILGPRYDPKHPDRYCSGT